jgi:hypothetical protein
VDKKYKQNFMAALIQANAAVKQSPAARGDGWLYSTSRDSSPPTDTYLSQEQIELGRKINSTPEIDSPSVKGTALSKASWGSTTAKKRREMVAEGNEAELACCAAGSSNSKKRKTAYCNVDMGADGMTCHVEEEEEEEESLGRCLFDGEGAEAEVDPQVTEKRTLIMKCLYPAIARCRSDDEGGHSVDEVSALILQAPESSARGDLTTEDVDSTLEWLVTYDNKIMVSAGAIFVV